MQRQRAADLRRHVREERADELRRLDVAGRLQVRDAVVRVHLRAAEVLGGDPLARDRLDHLRTGQEQPRVRARP